MSDNITRPWICPHVGHTEPSFHVAFQRSPCLWSYWYWYWVHPLTLVSNLPLTNLDDLSDPEFIGSDWSSLYIDKLLNEWNVRMKTSVFASWTYNWPFCLLRGWGLNLFFPFPNILKHLEKSLVQCTSFPGTKEILKRLVELMVKFWTPFLS